MLPISFVVVLGGAALSDPSLVDPKTMFVTFASNIFPGVAGVVGGTQNPVSIVCTQPVFVSANTRSDLATYNGDSVTSWNVVNLP